MMDHLEKIEEIAIRCGLSVTVNADHELVEVCSDNFGVATIWVDGHVSFESEGDVRIRFRKIPHRKKLPLSKDILLRLSREVNCSALIGRCIFNNIFGSQIDYEIYVNGVDDISDATFTKTLKYLSIVNSLIESMVDMALEDMSEP